MSGLQTYQDNLDYIIGENGNFTEQAVYDPSGLDEIIYGIFDLVDYRADKDSSGNQKKQSRAHFVVSSAPDFDIYSEKFLHLVERGETYQISYIEKDLNGVQKIWLF
jgi:hypothetical protein